MSLKVKDILKATNGNLIIGNLEQECEGFIEDTRKIKPNGTYVAIKGEKVDGSIFWEEAFKNGANAVILNKFELDPQKIEKYKETGKIIIEVEDTIEALRQMAIAKRKMYDGKLKVIGVTGSVGKTSTKDIIANVLSKKYKVLKTEGNNNNHIGLPLTLLRLKDEEIAVVEMGMNHLDEIRYLSKIARPNLAVITNIGTSHIGNLGSRKNILKAKLEILDGMENKELIINNDNDLLHEWNLENKENIKIHTFGINNKSEVQAINIISRENISQFTCKENEKTFEVTIPQSGEHFVLNALCAICVGNLLNMEISQIQDGLKDFKLTAKRMEIVNLKDNIVLINDSYNASFESMKASILTLMNMNGNRKIAVLGDMFELGNFAEELHRKVGKEIAKNKVDKLYLIGENSKYIAEEAIREGYNKNNIVQFEERNELIEQLNKNITSGDIVLFKASNGMKLFNIVEELKSRIGEH